MHSKYDTIMTDYKELLKYRERHLILILILILIDYKGGFYMFFVPYITFNGNASDAISFYSKVLGAQSNPNIMYYKEAQGMDIPSGYEDKILHSELNFPGGSLYISDAFPGSDVIYTDSISFTLEPDSKESLNTLFDLLSEGGTVIQPLKEEFWGAIFGSVKDKFGIYWGLNYQLPTK